jgi:flavin reductase (DIM6/NTAB) family NADH-FMN oxidoreductase RutF
MLKEIALTNAYRVTPTGLYLISTAHDGKRNVQFAFRALGLGDDPPLLLIGIQDKNFSRGVIQKSGEFVINVCSQNQLHAVDKSRDLSGRNVEDKFVALDWKRSRHPRCKRRWSPAATPMSNAS